MHVLSSFLPGSQAGYVGLVCATGFTGVFLRSVQVVRCEDRRAWHKASHYDITKYTSEVHNTLPSSG